MKTLKLVTTVFFFTLYAQAQVTLQKGFDHLEKGNFAAAETYFESYLNTDPENKTAQICYGRAVGLNGAPQKAKVVFNTLLVEYPNDFEVIINYNESFLWAEEYATAKPLYEKLVAEYPSQFGAVLGYANTLSNLKEYKKALEWVNKALMLEPDNESAKISRKYMKLGYANDYVNAQDYEHGIALLQDIFTDFPEDKDALLNLANVYLILKTIESAKTTYWRYATTAKDSITAQNGIVLAEHIAENDKAALKMARATKNKVDDFNDTELIKHSKKAAEQVGIEIKEGVYAAISGPYYFSKAELRMLRLMGGDTIGMSTIPETIVANHSGIRVLGISCVTDMAIPDTLEPLEHEQVMAIANQTKPKFIKLIKQILKEVN